MPSWHRPSRARWLLRAWETPRVVENFSRTTAKWCCPLSVSADTAAQRMRHTVRARSEPDETMKSQSDLPGDLRHSVLELHRALRDAQRIRYEREHGRIE